MRISCIRRALAIVSVFFILLDIFQTTRAEDTYDYEYDYSEDETVIFYVTASRLNGRYYPTKKSSVEALFDHDDRILGTGKFSKNHLWIEILAGECGTVWCDIRYLTERKEPFKVRNLGKSTVKIRKRPVIGKVIGYLKPNRTLTISQVVLGWGRCKSGWIDLTCVIEEPDDEP